MKGEVEIWLFWALNFLPCPLCATFPVVSSVHCLTDGIFQLCLQCPKALCQVDKVDG